MGNIFETAYAMHQQKFLQSNDVFAIIDCFANFEFDYYPLTLT